MEDDSNKPKILHIEDDNSIAITVAGIIGTYADIVHVTTLEQARVCLHETPFDLVLLDLQLPDGSGLDILPLISNEKNIPVIVHSATEVADTINNVSAVLCKSYLNPIELLNTIKEQIGK